MLILIERYCNHSKNHDLKGKQRPDEGDCFVASTTTRVSAIWATYGSVGDMLLTRMYTMLVTLYRNSHVNLQVLRSRFDVCRQTMPERPFHQEVRSMDYLSWIREPSYFRSSQLATCRKWKLTMSLQKKTAKLQLLDELVHMLNKGALLDHTRSRRACYWQPRRRGRDMGFSLDYISRMSFLLALLPLAW